ncbi:sugar transferase [Eggerthella sinensis]|uniref:sugar transferase n=1 Tax=Eggerthella sinensis TaxID=242230 RepID=UPI00266C1F99|nr:sugar transferase [Eggerthella sinensis]
MFEKNPDNSIDLTAGGAAALIDDYASAGEPQQDTPTPPKSDKRGYVNSNEFEASDVALLAPELTSEAEGPLQAPTRADGRLGYRFVKRAFDIAFSLCVVVVGLVPIALLCLIIRLESSGSPIYRQQRVGYRGRPLRIFKLRTMVAGSDDVEKHLSPRQLEQWARERKVDDDPRITRIGGFLRKMSMAPVIIGIPGDGEPTKSLSHPENTSLDLQKCERRPRTSLGVRYHYTSFQFLSSAVFGGPKGALGRPLCARAQVSFACVGTAA